MKENWYYQTITFVLNNILTEKKTVLLLIPDDISIEEELYKEMEVNVNFYDKTKFEKMLKKH